MKFINARVVCKVDYSSSFIITKELIVSTVRSRENNSKKKTHLCWKVHKGKVKKLSRRGRTETKKKESIKKSKQHKARIRCDRGYKENSFIKVANSHIYTSRLLRRFRANSLRFVPVLMQVRPYRERARERENITQLYVRWKDKRGMSPWGLHVWSPTL